MAPLDYRDVVSHKEKPEPGKRSSGTVRARWWEIPEEDIAKAVCDTGTSLEQMDGERQAALIRFARLYENVDVSHIGGRYADGVARALASQSGFLTLNVGASCVDTVTAKVTKNKPRPYFLTSGASWSGQMKARNLDKWSRGFLYQTKYYQKARPVFVDGGVFGTGLLHVFPTKDKKLDCERVLLSEILVDELDARYGEPRQMVRRKYVPRDILKRLFPKKATEIESASPSADIADANSQQEVVDNTIQVWEAWHLPSGPGAKDGKHCIAIDGCLLMCEEWKIEKFPFVVYRYKKRTTGFHGKGIVESVQPIQVSLNRSLRSMDNVLRRKGKGRTWVQVGSKVNVKAMTNADGGDIGYYTGNPPVIENQNATASEDMNYILFLYAKAFQEIGVSEMSASSKKPSGLDAAVALREYSDIESERFATQHQDWEQMALDFLELSIDLITKQWGWGGYKVLVPGRRDLLEVDWADIDLQRDSYIMQMWPTSSLPGTPAARLQRVEELRSKGYITDTQAKRLLEFPDIEAEMHLGNAAIDDADATISAILDDPEPTLKPLEPYQNIELIIERANAAYLFARHRNCPEERLALLRQLIDTATAQQVQMMAAQRPAMPGAPMGDPSLPSGAPSLPGAPMGAPALTGGLQINNTQLQPVTPAVPPLVNG